MPEVRVVGILRMKDRRAAFDVLVRVRDVAADIQGVRVWEAFADNEAGLVYLNELFDSEESYLQYETAADEQGLRPKISEALDLEHILLLTPIHNRALRTFFDGVGGTTVESVASI